MDTLAQQLESQRVGARQFEGALQRAQAAAAAAGRRGTVHTIQVRKVVALEAQVEEAKEMAASHQCMYVSTTDSKLGILSFLSHSFHGG